MPNATLSRAETPPRSARDLVEEAKREVTLVSCEEAARQIAAGKGAPAVIDVREEYEHEMMRLGGSVHISRGTLEMGIEQEFPNRATPLLLYCARGDRSALAAVALKRMGYQRVASLDGGIHAWRDSGYEVVVPTGQVGPGSGI